MTPRATLCADDLRAVMAGFRDALRSHQSDINRLNVYPVPDGDTGTNMALTLEAVVAELDGVPAEAGLAEVCKAIGHGSLMGARGNSGVILSQLLRGMSERMGAVPDGVDAGTLALALEHAAELARRAVVRPVEGTILTVASAAAQGAAEAVEPTLLAVITSAHATAADALARTPEMPARAQAGRRGRCRRHRLPSCCIDAFWLVVDGRPLPRAVGRPAPVVNLEGLSLAAGNANGEGGEGEHNVGDLRYEVRVPPLGAGRHRSTTSRKGCGPGSGGLHRGGRRRRACQTTRIHTDDIGAAVEAGVDAGRPQRIRVTDLAEQVVEERWVRAGGRRPRGGPQRGAEQASPPTTSVVAVVTRRRHPAGSSAPLACTTRWPASSR